MKKQEQQLKPLRIAEYKSTFLRPTELVARQGKTVYISPEFHAKLSRIAFEFGEGKIGISDYLNSVLASHFREFGDEIRFIYDCKSKPIL